MKCMLRLAFIILWVSFLFCLPSLAVSDTPMPQFGPLTVGDIGASTSIIEVDENHIYIGSGASIIILENSDEGLNAEGIQFSLPSLVTDLKAREGKLYAAVGSSGLYIIDIKDPSNPVEMGIYKSSGSIGAIEVQGSILYAADSNDGLLVIDTSNPAKPFMLSQAFKGKSALELAFNHDAVYIAAGNDGFLSADISKPDAPRELGSFKTNGYARDVALWGGYAYIAEDTGGICIADITGSPYLIDRIETSARFCRLRRDQNHLFADDLEKGLRVFDISKPLKPSELPSHQPEGARLVKDFNKPLHITNVELKKPPIQSTAPSQLPESNAQSSQILPSQQGGKVAYITIDDGPSTNNTPAILEILKKYGIKATFFVLPNDKAVDIYQRILDEGHVIGNHSYCHDYDYLYSSPDNFKNDVVKARTYINNTLNYTTTVFRFPGGAMGKNKDIIKRRTELLKELGYSWYDWNASTGDSDPNIKKYGDEERIVTLLTNNVLNHTSSKSKLIVLMHDSYTKTYTVKALPRIIEGLIKQGYRFDVLTNY